ncbi:hypothetical protein [Mesorhizobium amorphae]|uniref:Uncharacterized protein n=1 Tax=Mesorhizobium amorphae CCNWGS0123 TaxID=1082933 RepID=G6YDL1_9HYPH|nr:hypothetical protein [Mesorhizobium amorphae]EHH10181.1 hypothetical protein MEA186_20259 [Mesorhizobium amorphae CCNWGS0123]
MSVKGARRRCLASIERGDEGDGAAAGRIGDFEAFGGLARRPPPVDIGEFVQQPMVGQAVDCVMAVRAGKVWDMVEASRVGLMRKTFVAVTVLRSRYALSLAGAHSSATHFALRATDTKATATSKISRRRLDTRTGPPFLGGDPCRCLARIVPSIS